jgi:hypothetical protein
LMASTGNGEDRGVSRNKGASVFKTQTKPDDTTHEHFNRGGIDGAQHGHRVTRNFGTAEEETIYVRDNDGIEYDVGRHKTPTLKSRK